jgi:hypothetical protein
MISRAIVVVLAFVLTPQLARADGQPPPPAPAPAPAPEQTGTVTVTELPNLPPLPAGPPIDNVELQRGRTLRIAGEVLMLVGVAGAVVMIAGVLHYALCVVCDDATSWAVIGVGAVVAAGGIGAGLPLYLLGRSAEQRALHAQVALLPPTVGSRSPSGATLNLSLAF